MFTLNNKANLKMPDSELVDNMLSWGFESLSGVAYYIPVSTRSDITLTERNYGNDAYSIARDIFPEAIRN